MTRLRQKSATARQARTRPPEGKVTIPTADYHAVLRTMSELRWAIHDLFVYFETPRSGGGYTHAEAARLEEIRRMAPKPICRVVI
jgi:hypothetical protein